MTGPRSGSPIGCPVETSQRRIVASQLPLASTEPSGLKAMLEDSLEPAQRLADRLPGRDVPEADRRLSPPVPLASIEPSGLKATLVTARSCPRSGSPIGCPVETSQRRIVQSLRPARQHRTVRAEGDALGPDAHARAAARRSARSRGPRGGWCRPRSRSPAPNRPG